MPTGSRPREHGCDVARPSTSRTVLFSAAAALLGSTDTSSADANRASVWATTGTSSEPKESGSNYELIFAMATFTPPAAADYVLPCEGKVSSGWEHFDLLAMQAATTIADASGEEDEP